MMASVLRAAKREKGDSTAWNSLFARDGKKIAMKMKQEAMQTATQSAGGTRVNRTSRESFIKCVRDCCTELWHGAEEVESRMLDRIPLNVEPQLSVRFRSRSFDWGPGRLDGAH